MTVIDGKYVDQLGQDQPFVIHHGQLTSTQLRVNVSRLLRECHAGRSAWFYNCRRPAH